MYGLNLEKIALSIQGETENILDREPSGVSIDTRSLKKGDLFLHQRKNA
jgi:UDP-N-acetylmuramyl pentapeptide synthase